MNAPLAPSFIEQFLTGINGFRFEQFVKALLIERDGKSFIALGGVHDGGADGALRSVYEELGDSPTQHFVQISNTADESARTKVRQTIVALKKSREHVRSVTYWTDKEVGKADKIEDELGKEFGITVRVRSGPYLDRLINHSPRTQDLFRQEFRAEIFRVHEQAALLNSFSADFVSDPSVYVFLEFQRTDRLGRGGLVAPIVDALIYWCLRDSDPDKSPPVIIARRQIADRIRGLFPTAASTLLPSLDARLRELSRKEGNGHQRIRFYKILDSFSLPFEMRTELAGSAATEMALQSRTKASLIERAREAGAKNPETIADVCERAIYKHFHEQGLILAAFLEGRLEGMEVSDQIVEAELDVVARSGEIPDSRSHKAALTVLQQIFYSPSETERNFLARLSRTSLLLFSLNHSPKLLEYFSKLTGSFTLLVGTDILVKALSEIYLQNEQRHCTNLLRVISAMGAKLVLTEPVVEEVYSHLRATHLEFLNHYMPREPYISTVLAGQSERIFIRTYFYARRLLHRVSGWKQFLNQFADYELIHTKSEKGLLQIQAFLCKRFSLKYVTRAEITQGVDIDLMKSLTESQQQVDPMKRRELFENDSLMALAVYSRRKANGESMTYDGFGMKTWWLTKEMRILQHTGHVVRANHSVPYIMRPEFLLNFLALSPNTGELDESLRTLLPSHVGLQIGKHLPDSQMHRILEAVEEWEGLPSERVEVKINDLVDRLKFDRLKRYQTNLDTHGQADNDFISVALRQADEALRQPNA